MSQKASRRCPYRRAPPEETSSDEADPDLKPVDEVHGNWDVTRGMPITLEVCHVLTLTYTIAKGWQEGVQAEFIAPFCPEVGRNGG